ncbi:MAG: phosphomannose isomerase type II C-terminal cupin domain [Candidatus Doudnabacteria bacterium]|nr:phosphomannose isomerase type II C-terminal cupin domain [Candidatus Doudnabacteria bacterium]
MNNNYIEQRPWGQFEILAKFEVKPQGDVCVKIITVRPKAKLSYQSHKLRGEHWTFVQGRGTVILDGEESTVVPGSGINIPVGTKHRVINESEVDLVFIETSSGHFDENDIERFEDDYGRIK